MSEYWIQTYTGKRFDLLEPTLDTICIEDIAHHLSIENRYNGATFFPYSVAYHSYLVCLKAEIPYKLGALLHDAHEAYTKDLTSPMRRILKNTLRSFPKYAYETIVNRIQELIFEKFNVENYDGELIKIIDLRIARTERDDLLSASPDKWHSSIENLEPYFDIQFMNLSATNAEELFLKEYEKWRRD